MKDKIYVELKKLFNEPVCELKFEDNFQLLISVILSAQCTDKRVNLTTPALFAKYPTPEELSRAELSEVERLIKSCGFYHNKAKNIINAAKDVTKKFNGKVPGTLEELLTLSGVGQKTANVVFSVGFGGDAIAVDTHVFRVTNRLGVANAKTPSECEKQLEKFFDKEVWSEIHHMLVLFGRYYCTARNPKCEGCVFNNFCKFYKERN